MNVKRKPEVGLPIWQRRLAGFAGTAAGCGVLAAVTLLYAEAARMTWLAPTPDNVAAMKRCEQVHGTAQRQRCVQTVMAEVRGREGARQLAGRDRDPYALAPGQ